MTAPKPVVRTVTATRYVTPLREGGSLPAIVEADDDGTYVLKFRGAGQGPKALVAELIAAELGRALALPVPEVVLVELDAALGRAEPDPEIKDLILASAGLNFGMDFLPGSLAYNPIVPPPPEAALASAIVWFDAYLTNVDRTPRNPNLLVWHKRLWMIDHGAALYVQHTWSDYLARARGAFPQIKDHVLLPFASRIAEADANLSRLITPELLRSIVAKIPERWLEPPAPFASVAELREAYVAYLLTRLAPPRAFVEEAIRAGTETGTGTGTRAQPV